MIQAFRLILHFLQHFQVPPRFFLPYWKSFFPSTLLRNVGIKIMVYHVHANSLGAMLSSIEKSLRERRNKGHFDNEADKGFERREQ